MIGNYMYPDELVDYWIAHPSDMPLSAVIGLCDKNGYVIPSAQLAELEAIDARRKPKKSDKAAPLVEPTIPVGYRRGALVDDSAVIDQSSDGGILAENGAVGVLVEGGDDMDRGAVAASLLLAMQARYRINDVDFTDWADMMDRCRAAPLYGTDSVDAALNPLKDVSVLVLHGVDCYIRSRDGAENLGKVLRSRAANGKKTIMTSSIAWPMLKRTVGEGGDLHGHLAACIARCDRKVNVVRLVSERD